MYNVYRCTRSFSEASCYFMYKPRSGSHSVKDENVLGGNDGAPMHFNKLRFKLFNHCDCVIEAKLNYKRFLYRKF